MNNLFEFKLEDVFFYKGSSCSVVNWLGCIVCALFVFIPVVAPIFLLSPAFSTMGDDLWLVKFLIYLASVIFSLKLVDLTVYGGIWWAYLCGYMPK